MLYRLHGRRDIHEIQFAPATFSIVPLALSGAFFRQRIIKLHIQPLPPLPALAPRSIRETLGARGSLLRIARQPGSRRYAVGGSRTLSARVAGPGSEERY